VKKKRPILASPPIFYSNPILGDKNRNWGKRTSYFSPKKFNLKGWKKSNPKPIGVVPALNALFNSLIYGVIAGYFKGCGIKVLSLFVEPIFELFPLFCPCLLTSLRSG